MKLRLLVTASLMLALSVSARELADGAQGFRIEFPDGHAWSPIEKEEPAKGVTHYSSTNQASGVCLSLLVFALPSGVSDKNFEKNAQAWERGFVRKATKSEPGEFMIVAGLRAYCIKTMLRKDGSEIYFTTWFIQKSPNVFQVSSSGRSAIEVDDKVAHDFVSSIRLK